MKLLGIMLRNKCWLITFRNMTTRDADGWCLIERCDQPLIGVNERSLYVHWLTPLISVGKVLFNNTVALAQGRFTWGLKSHSC